MTSKQDNVLPMSLTQIMQLFPDLREDYVDEMETAEHLEARIIAKGKHEINRETMERKLSALIIPYFVFEYGKSRSPEISRFTVKEQVAVYAKRWGAHRLFKSVNPDKHFTVAHITLVDPLEIEETEA